MSLFGWLNGKSRKELEENIKTAEDQIAKQKDEMRDMRNEEEASRQKLENHIKAAKDQIARQNDEMKDMRKQEEASRQVKYRLEEELRQAQSRHKAAEDLRAKEREDSSSRLNAEQEERRREQERTREQMLQQRRAREELQQEVRQAREELQTVRESNRQSMERAREELEQQARATEHLLAQELQRERHRVKLEKWQRLKKRYPIPTFIQNFVNEVTEDAEADAAREPFVNIAMLGDPASGKRRFMKPVLQHLAVDDVEGDGGFPRQFQIEKGVFLWDLPKHNELADVRNMGLRYFDIVCIFTASDTCDKLLEFLYDKKIQCFLLRTKVDRDVDDHQDEWSEENEDPLSQLHQKLLHQTGLRPERIHLLQSKEDFATDFGSVEGFCKDLQKDVKDVKASKPNGPKPEIFDKLPENLHFDCSSRKRKAEDWSRGWRFCRTEQLTPTDTHRIKMYKGYKECTKIHHDSSLDYANTDDGSCWVHGNPHGSPHWRGSFGHW